MSEKKTKIGRKGGAKLITEKLKAIRQAPLSKEVFRIVDESSSDSKPLKKVAISKMDLES